MKRHMIAGILVVLLAMLGPPHGKAQELPEAPSAAQDVDEQATFIRLYGLKRAAALDATTGYYWITGSAFHPRDSSVQLMSTGNCVYRTTNPTSSFADADQITAQLHLPNTTKILGIRYYFKDSSGTNSTISLVKYAGTGTTTSISGVNSSGNGGYASVYVAALSPHVVDNASGGLALNWKTTDFSSNMLLCGARLYVEYPPSTPIGITASNQPNAGIEQHAAFYVGGSFQRRESTTQYVTTADGCLQSSTGGAFTIDVNLPTGATINGITLYSYADIVNTASSATLTRYNGAGSSQLIKAIERDPGASSGFDAISASITNYPINETNEAYVVTINLPNDGVNHGVCGVKIEYALTIPTFGPTPIPAATFQRESIQQSRGTITKSYHRWIAGIAFNGYDSTTSFGALSGSCTRILGGTAKLIAPLQLPDGATLNDVVLYYSDNNPSTNSTMELIESDAATASNVVVNSTSTNSAGYGAVAASPTTTYVVDGASYPLNLVWTTPTSDSSQQLCGMRVSYTLQMSAPIFVPFLSK